ncbi:hypothetical protein ADN00_18650 [Ornatilinea apprima]|uniref:Uncharacterized protein n=1 Tax=Ornatilinea apprima TaxID=1134406 RepID=A0A0P6WVU5_9CHLR|nr:hypothetical protein ADN00_18650 [Ornatilinea apprima]
MWGKFIRIELLSIVTQEERIGRWFAEPQKKHFGNDRRELVLPSKLVKAVKPQLRGMGYNLLK